MLCSVECPIKHYTNTLFGCRNMKSLQVKFRTVRSKPIYLVWMIYGIHNILVLDDLMTDLCKSNWCYKLFTLFPHHLKWSSYLWARPVSIIENNAQYISQPIICCAVSLKQRPCTDKCYGFTAGWDANIALGVRLCHIWTLQIFGHKYNLIKDVISYSNKYVDNISKSVSLPLNV